MTMTRPDAAAARLRRAAPHHHGRAARAGDDVRVRGGRGQPGDAQRGAGPRWRDALPDRRDRHAHRRDRRDGRRRHLGRRPRRQPAGDRGRPRLRGRTARVRVRRLDGGPRRRPVAAGARRRRRTDGVVRRGGRRLPGTPPHARVLAVRHRLGGAVDRRPVRRRRAGRPVRLALGVPGRGGVRAAQHPGRTRPMSRHLAVRDEAAGLGPPSAVRRGRRDRGRRPPPRRPRLRSPVSACCSSPDSLVVAFAAGPLLPRGTTRASPRASGGDRVARPVRRGLRVRGAVPAARAPGRDRDEPDPERAGDDGRRTRLGRRFDVLREARPPRDVPPDPARGQPLACSSAPLITLALVPVDHMPVVAGLVATLGFATMAVGHGSRHAADVDALPRPRTRGSPGRHRRGHPDERLARSEHRRRAGGCGVRALVPDRRSTRRTSPASGWRCCSRSSRRSPRGAPLRTADRTAPSWPSPAPRGSSAARSRRS